MKQKLTALALLALAFAFGVAYLAPIVAGTADPERLHVLAAYMLMAFGFGVSGVAVLLGGEA